MTTDATTTPPAAPSGPVGDESALRDLLRRRVDLFPALRRADCPPETLGEYLAVCGAIIHFQVRIGMARFRAIKAEVGRCQD